MKIKEIKIREDDGSYSDPIPVGADAVNVDTRDGSTVQSKLDGQNEIISSHTKKINTLEQSIEGLASGSPKGSYTTVSALVSANPDTGVYVVQENGHVYSWTKNGSSAIDLGVYQSTEINIEDENYLKLEFDDNAYFNSIYTGELELYKGKYKARGFISDSTGVFSLKTDINLGASDFFIKLPIDSDIIVSSDIARFNLYFYNSEKIFISSLYDNGSLSAKTYTFHNTEYTYCRIGAWIQNLDETKFNNIKIVVKNNDSYINKILHSNIGEIVTYNKINIDSSSQKIVFPNQTYLFSRIKHINLSNKEYDISQMISKGGMLWFDQDDDLIYSSYANDRIFLGAIWINLDKVELNTSLFNLQIDSMPINYSSNNSNIKIGCLGDSMTKGSGTTKIYYEWFKQLLGFRLNIINYGLGGSSITPKQDAYPNWEENIPSFLERSSNMDTDLDIVLIFGGVNDWVTGRELGDINNNNTYTFYGALKQMLENLIEKYKSKRIYFFTSPQNDYIHRPANIPNDNQYYGNQEGKNRKGYKITNYTDAIVEVCNLYGIPVLDLQKNSWYGLSGVLGYTDHPGIYGTDSLHPNREGHKILALKMANFINNN